MVRPVSKSNRAPGNQAGPVRRHRVAVHRLRPAGKVPDLFWPVILRTDPPTLMTEEEAYKKVPAMKVTHLPATMPREERDGAQAPRE